MELTIGYKRTEIGVIPENWNVVRIGTLITDFRGGAPLKPTDFTKTGVKVLPKGGVGRTGWLQVEESDLQYCSPPYALSHLRNQVDESFTIVVLRDLVPSGPSIGLMVKVRSKERYVLAQGVYGFKVTDSIIPDYLVQLSNTYWYRILMNSIMVGSTQVHITNTAFKRVDIPLPPAQEQEAIATALSNVDELMKSLDRLIAKKRDMKQAVMQWLLSGKHRLPGYEGEWKVKRLGEIADLKNGYSFKSETYNQLGSFKIVTISNVQDGFMDMVECSTIDVIPKDVQPHHKLIKGDVLISMTGNVGRICKVNEENCLLNQRVGKLVALNIAPSLLFYLLSQRTFIASMETKAKGGAQGNLSVEDITEHEFTVPKSNEEQAAIAAVLSDIDAEIVALEQRRDKTIALKQGMMQELLTGRIRLVRPSN